MTFFNKSYGEWSKVEKPSKKNEVVLKIVVGLQDHLSCEVRFSGYKKQAWLRQPHLIKNFEKKFGDQLEKVLSHKTPGMPKFLVVRPMIDGGKISAEDQDE